MPDADAPVDDGLAGETLPGSGDPIVDDVIALLDGLDPDSDPADLLPTLAQAHDELAQRLRAAEG